MNFVVLGPESSGSTLIAKTIATAIGVKDYNGRFWSKSNKRGDKVCHRSLPYGGKEKHYPPLDEFKEPCKFILCTRDMNCVSLSKEKKHSELIEDIQKHNETARQMMHKLMETRNCFIWSYETFLFLREPYLQLLYEFLGIKSDYFPFLRDGNKKWVKQ